MLKTVPHTFSYLHLFFDTGNQIFVLVFLLFETGCHVSLNSPCNRGGSSTCDPLASTSWMLALQGYIFVSRSFIVGNWTQLLSNGRQALYQLSYIPNPVICSNRRVLLLSVCSVLCVLDINPFSNERFANVFSHSASRLSPCWTLP